MKKFLLSVVTVIFILTSSCLFAETSYFLKVNGKEFSEKQFEIWWHYWKEKNTPFPKSAQPFIDWILLSDESEAIGLNNEISYKKKLAIFKEVRALLQLRYDEVEKKIDINPDKLWNYYKKNYAPLFKIKAIVLKDLEKANLLKNNIKFKNDFYKSFEILKKNNKVKELGWQRPVNMPPIFKRKILSSKKDSILNPIFYKGHYYILLIEDKKLGSKDDFNKIHKNIAVKYKKYEEGILTEKLLNKLKKKYNIIIDWKTIKDIKPFQKLPKDIRDKKVVCIEKRGLTGKQFKKMLEKDVKLRRKNQAISDKKLEKFKKSIVNSTVNQTLTTLEGLNRHYENNVMKDIYWFYRRNRLIAELESKIIAPSVKVFEKETEKYYNEHKGDFTKPAIVEIAVIQTKDRKIIEHAYKRILKGEDFFEIARDIQVHGALPVLRRLDSLVKDVRERIKTMRQGTISKIINYKEWYFIVKLIKKEKKQLHKFETVKKSIKKLLYKQKLNKAKENFLEKLRKKSNIKINSAKWEKISNKEGKKEETR